MSRPKKWLPADGSRIDGYIGVEWRLALEEDERIEITGLVDDSAARWSGLGRTLVDAAEQWALQHGLRTIVVRSNIVRRDVGSLHEDHGRLRGDRERATVSP